MTTVRRSFSRKWATIAFFAVGAIAICTVIARTTRVDPMVGFEAASAVVIGAWGALLMRNLWLGRKLGLALESRTVATNLAGIDLRLIRGQGQRAFVIGMFRPTVYLDEGLLVGRHRLAFAGPPRRFACRRRPHPQRESVRVSPKWTLTGFLREL